MDKSQRSFGFRILILLFLFALVEKIYGQTINESGSFYTGRLNDSKAVYLEKKNFDVSADGIHDDAPAIQKAINTVADNTRSGVVFIPEGTYRIGSTINIWVGIRVIGYGKNRPVFILAENSPGFQEGEEKYVVRFCDRRIPDGEPVRDGTPGTLFSGMSNINIKIEEGNPAGIAVRFHVAQHSFLTHMNFYVGSARAAIEEAGNEIQDCHFFGGEWAIKTGLPSAGWQAMVLDSRFEGQRKMAIESKDAGLAVIRCRFNNLPNAINIRIGDNEKLFVKDSWFENISESAINIGNYFDPRTQVNMENLKFSNVPVSVNFSVLPGVSLPVSRDSLRHKTNWKIYSIRNLSHGLHIGNNASKEPERKFNTIKNQVQISSLGEFTISDIPGFAPQQSCINIVEAGAKGDGKTDDTQVFKNVIQKHGAIYIPMGNYVISETLLLRKETALIGMHPRLTRIILKDSTKGFTDVNNPKPLIITPRGGRNILSGIGFDLGINPGVIGIKWLAGNKSYFNDVYFPGRRGSARGEGQYYGVWVTDGGGGVFKSSWLPNSLARNGFFVSNTTTQGNTYMLSIEHHKDVEVLLRKVENWNFYSLQTEEDLGSENAYAIILEDCKNINFTNLYCYRRAALAAPFISAVKIKNSSNLVIKGLHNFSSGPFPYDNSVFIDDSGTLVRHPEVARFTLQ